MRVRAIAGPATIRNSSGRTEIGSIAGELRVNAANGDVTIGRVEGTVVARTAFGSIRVDDVVHGSVQIQTAYGQLDIGIREGTAAWLDVQTRYGRVRNVLTPLEASQPTNATAEIRARTAYGDITIRRSARPLTRSPREREPRRV